MKMAKFDPDVRPDPEAEKLRRKVLAAVRALRKKVGDESAGRWLAGHAESLMRLDLSMTRAEGALEKHADNQARMMQRLDREQRRFAEWREQNRHLRGEED
jgi:hypothetical protein